MHNFLVGIIITVLTLFLRFTITPFNETEFFCCFSLSLGSFGHLAISWYSYPYLKHLGGVSSVRRLSGSPDARYFSLSFIILSKHFSVEWLAPPQKLHFV